MIVSYSGTYLSRRNNSNPLSWDYVSYLGFSIVFPTFGLIAIDMGKDSE